jgi:Tol biopolymer transport system component
VIDALTRATRRLVAGRETGWMFDPAYSPDGSRVAVYWNRPPTRAIWVVSLEDKQEYLVHEVAPMAAPVSWSSDGRSIFVLEGQRILALPLTGQEPRVVARLPFDGIGTVSMTPDGGTFVCSVHESHSDVWMVEDIEPRRVDSSR